MAISVSDLIWSKTFRTTVLAVVLIAGTLIELYLHLFLGISTGYTHFYYLFLVPLAILFQRNTVFFGIYLAGLHVAIEWMNAGAISEATWFRAIMFVAVAYVSGYIFAVIERRNIDLLTYLAERSSWSRISPDAHADEMGEIEPRTVAGTTVMNLKRNANIRGLVSALSHRDVEVRYRAAIALGDLGDPAAVEPLSHALKDENSGVRWEAAEALGKIGGPAVHALAKAVHDEDDDIRWRAAIALGEIGGDEAIEALIEALSDEDAYVRSRAINSLAAIGEPAIEPLRAAYPGGDAQVRGCVTAALSRIGDPGREALQQLSAGEAKQ
ncbi:MAG: HEAT repeat domain-containing protein [Methanomicrobiaceae archaeon]|nr:HEAT repeat domain-containing protein [Methanomicrobiaceae archaeon]